MPLILKATEDASQRQEAVRHAAQIIAAGGIVAFPTETVYGLAALASDQQAVDRVFHLKRRPAHKPLSVLVSALADLQAWVEIIPAEAYGLAERFCPGPLTLVFAAAKDLPSSIDAGTGKLGARMSAHPIARALIQAVGVPITATSANRSGAPSCRSAAEVCAQRGSELEADGDGGLTPGSKGSTIADVTTRPPEILRVGTIAAEEILSWWRAYTQVPAELHRSEG
jgi:L-threonylcarbamoyladenylate synthase